MRGRADGRKRPPPLRERIGLKRQRYVAFAFMAFGLTTPASGQEQEAAAVESREIEFKHIWTGETLRVVYKVGEVYDPAGMARIDWFMRDWRCKKATAMDRTLIDLLYDLYKATGAKGPIRVLSAYRSEGLNASLLRSGHEVDPDSQHMKGKAIDVSFSGIPLSRLKEAAEARHAGGVGHYPGSRPAFVHLDTGLTRGWEESPGGYGRRRLQLDCNLTMAEALREVTPGHALAVLPPSAAANEKSAAGRRSSGGNADAKSKPAAPPTHGMRLAQAKTHRAKPRGDWRKAFSRCHKTRGRRLRHKGCSALRLAAATREDPGP
jgi:uncharacterized protein YcbK (DUF882 family)